MEESTTGGSITKAYVYGEGIDEVVRASLPDAADLDGDLNTSETIDLYYHYNSLGSVMAVTDASGDIASYGKVSIFDDTGASVDTGTFTLSPTVSTAVIEQEGVEVLVIDQDTGAAQTGVLLDDSSR